MKLLKRSVQRPDGSADPMQVFFAAVVLLFIIAIGLLIYWQWFDDPRPLVVSEARPLTEEVRAGGTFIYLLSACKNASVGATVRRSWVDGIIYTMPEDHPTRVRPGCFEDLRVLLDVPEALPPGEYHLEVELEYRVNPIRSRTVSYVIGPVKIVD